MGDLATVLLLADTRFPTGAHAHSGGVESAHRAGMLSDVDDLAAFVDGRLCTSGWTDAVFAAAACGQRSNWAELDRALSVRTVSPRQRSVSRSLGRQLLRASMRAWPDIRLEELRSLHDDGPMQPVALGAVAAVAGLSPAEAALVSLHHLVGMVTTAAVRLMGLDPFDVQALAARVAPRLSEIAADADAAAMTGTDTELLPAVTSTLADVMAEHHATWEVRLFAS